MSDGFISLENQIELIDSIMKSTDKLIPLIDRNNPLDDAINHTILQIFRFLSKVIGLLPDLLVSDSIFKQYKNELNNSYDNVIDSWKNFNLEPDEFFNSWSEFSFWWTEFSKMLSKIKSSSSTIYLSMN